MKVLIVRAVWVLLLAFPLIMKAESRTALWKEVDDAARKGLPRTAITNLDIIIRGSLADKAYAEATKAIGRKIVLEANIQGNKPEEKIVRLEAELARTPSEMQPVLETLLAYWYRQYLQQNSWSIASRTATAQPPGKDFMTWDARRLNEEVDKHFQHALGAEKYLKATPIAAWDDLIEKGTMPENYRPTLYDFLVHEALGFYQFGFGGMPFPEDAFELEADSPVFLPPGDFLPWVEHLTADTNSALAKSLRLYRDLLRFHERDPEPQTAFAAADLERLEWALQNASGEDKDARYREALEQFLKTHAELDVSAMAMEHIGRLMERQGDPVGARKIAAQGEELFPKSPGGQLCHNLIAEIESRSLRLETEGVWNAPWPKISVHYKNITAVYFRAIPVDWAEFLQRRYPRPQFMNPGQRREFLSKPAVLQWKADLPATPDFKERGIDLPAPENLKPGFYFIAASGNEDFSEEDNATMMTSVWVSDLALVTRQRTGEVGGFVLDAASGEPIAGADISVWHLGQNGARISDPSLRTDTNGVFSMKPSENRNYLFRARHHGNEIASDELWGYGWNWEGQGKPFTQTVFFTDRSLYRPGQTIQYKGICLRADHEKGRYETLNGQDVTVIFADPNGKEIARQARTANDYGSFAGSFTAPRDRLMGRMTIYTMSAPFGSAQLSVEEYKRPKFEVSLDAPKSAPKLNETVSLTGHATSYTGAAVDGAVVKYHIVRTTQMPWWCRWWSPYRQDGQHEIAHGTAQTAADGSFKIEFTAKANPKALERDEPVFAFYIDADVTNGTGETRSAGLAVRAAYTALAATLQAGDWLTDGQPIELKIGTTTLDGAPQAAEGSIKVYALKPPAKMERPRLFTPADNSEDPSDPNNWPLGEAAAEKNFATGTNGSSSVSVTLPAGEYRAVLETADRFGKHVTAKLPLRVLQPEAPKLAIKIPHFLAAPKWELQPGDELAALWGTGYDSGRAFVEIEHRHEIIQRYWTSPGRTQQQIKFAITEALRGGFTLHVTQVRENRHYTDSRYVSVPWKNKELKLSWEHFNSKLRPGQNEIWTAIVKGPSSEKAAAEFVAGMYDESLDAFMPHNWPGGFGIFYRDSSWDQRWFVNSAAPFDQYNAWRNGAISSPLYYRRFPNDLTENYGGLPYVTATLAFGMGGGLSRMLSESEVAADTAEPRATASSPVKAKAGSSSFQNNLSLDKASVPSGQFPGPAKGPAAIDLAKVTARVNLTETAFFFPQLTTDSNGEVRMTFTMPEGLTKWHFLGFAHDRQLRGGLLEGHAFTSKDIMVQPNPPRFLREGDTVEFTAKVSNQSDKPQSGKVRLTFTQNGAEVSADGLLKNTSPERTFEIPSKESRSFSWRITVPDGAPYLTYKAVASTGEFSDGEEGGLPVLSRRVLVTESLPLPMRDKGKKIFDFTKLLNSGKSKTLRSQSLTVQMVSNPAWYAVLALPYLMEYPYECSEQTFNRLYANSLARSIANHDPKIRKIFDLWKNQSTLDSPLEKNQELKSVMIEETPWLNDALNESQARKNVGILFDDNRLNYETENTLEKLKQAQLDDGRWPWFPGGPASDYITLYIVAGFGRLRHLGADVPTDLAQRAIGRLDAWMMEHYDDIQKNWPHPEDYAPNPTDCLYLYGRSFFLKDKPIAAEHKKAIEFFLGQSRKLWLQTNWRQSQGQLAIALNRWGGNENAAAAQAIMRSLKEHSVNNEEMGMFWRDLELSWWWYRAPVETQALMIEAFDEVAHDDKAVEDCRVWLLKQKQTQDWRTTKATADAVYALLLRGRDWLSSTALVDVSLGGTDVTPKPQTSAAQKIEPGTGFYEVRFTLSDIKPKMGHVTVTKSDAGVAWGGAHWQYLEDISKVTPYEGTPLHLKKALFTKVATAHGQELQPVKGSLAVGDELVVRIELRTDRDMEFVHLKDQRGSGTEPVNVLSRYKYQDGLAYYESTRDTASHFFIDYLPKGTYVFEYSTRVQLRGEYQSGIAEIQCMYAPEFNSHSESVRLIVK